MKVLVFGAHGTLGSALQKRRTAQSDNADAYLDFTHSDITKRDEVFKAVKEHLPDVIFNCAAYNAVDAAEQDEAAAFALNADAPKFIAEAAEKSGALFIHFSTGFVFDGTDPEGYPEDAKPNPKSAYARSKFRGEENVRSACARSYIVRLNMLFGESGISRHSKKSFVDLVLGQDAQSELKLIDDERGSICYAPDAAQASLELALDALENKALKYPFGIYHLVNSGSASWYEWGLEIARLRKQRIEAPQDRSLRIVPVSGGEFKRAAERPKCSILLNTKFLPLRPWQAALAEFLIKE